MMFYLSNQTRRDIALPVWCAGLAATLWILHLMGAALPLPPVTSWSALGRWLETTDAADAIMSLVRIGALVAGWYLAGVTVLGMAAHLGDLRRTRRVADRLAPAALRRILRSAQHVGVSAAVLGAAAGPAVLGNLAIATPASAQEPDSDVVVMEIITETGETIEMPIDPLEPTRVDTRLPRPSGDFYPAAWHQIERPDETVESWTAACGDHLWAIAETTLGEAGLGTSDEEVARYWHELIEHNRDRLTDPDNPDLIYPGQIFDLPTPR